MQTMKNEYPAIYSAMNYLNKTNISNTIIEKLLNDVAYRNIDWHLQPTNDRLSSLLTSHPENELHEQLHDLLGSQWREYEKAETEISGLWYFNDIKIIKKIGFPKGGSSTPPFDCLVEIASQNIGIDIKSACNSGYRLLNDFFNPTFKNWLKSKNFPETFSIVYKHEGDISQQAVGRMRNQIINSFNSKLSTFNMIPDKIEIKLPSLNLFLKVVNDLEPLHSSGGMVMVENRVNSLLPTIIDHLSSKGVHAISNDVPFIICYTRLFGRGDADFSPGFLRDIIPQIINQCANQSWFPFWAGILYLDWGSYNLKKIGFFRDTNYPISQNQLCTIFNIDETI